MNILKGVHRLMVGEFFSFSKVYYKCYVNVLRVFFLNRAADGCAVSCSAFGLFCFIFF